MNVQMAKIDKAEIVAQLMRDGIEHELAELMVDAATKLIPSAAVIDGKLDPLALFMYGAAAALEQSAAMFTSAVKGVDSGEPCGAEKRATMRQTAFLLGVAAVMTDALAKSVGAEEQVVPQA